MVRLRFLVRISNNEFIMLNFIIENLILNKSLLTESSRGKDIK